MLLPLRPTLILASGLPAAWRETSRDRSSLTSVCRRGRPSRSHLVRACLTLPSPPLMPIFAGPAGSSTPPHSHNASSWSLLLAGIKVWYFISPGDAGSALSIAASTRSSGVQGAAAHRVQRVGEWEAEVLPLLRRAGIVVAHTVQRAGDVVFVPSGYLHATRNPGTHANASRPSTAYPSSRRRSAVYCVQSGHRVSDSTHLRPRPHHGEGVSAGRIAVRRGPASWHRRLVYAEDSPTLANRPLARLSLLFFFDLCSALKSAL